MIFILSILSLNSSEFYKNDGILADSILYFSLNKNNNIWITSNSIYSTHYVIDQNSKDPIFKANSTKILFENANLNQQLEKLIKSKKNYIRRLNGKSINLKLYSSSELVFKNIYSNIDLKLYFENSHLRFDYILRQGADPNRIALKFSDDILSNSKNTIQFKNWELKGLKTFYKDNKKKINSNFKLDGNKIKIELGNYNIDKEVVIDPVVYSTYLGGLDIDSGEDVVIDINGNTIVVGETMSINFPTSLGSYQRFFSSVDDSSNVPSEIFVTKVDNNFNEVFTTYIGGDRIDIAKGVDIDDDGNIVVVGYSNSDNFPVTMNAFDTTYNGGMDVVTLNLNSQGNDLIYSTYIGGASDDFGIDLKLTDDNSTILTGYTNQDLQSDSLYPVTIGSFSVQDVGRMDGFLTRVNTQGSDIIWSAYIGGLQDDFPQAIAMGPDSSFFVTGRTRSASYPTSDGVLYRFYNDLNSNPFQSDAFLSKIKLDGTEIIWSSLFGGSSGDIGYSLTVLSDTSVVVVGETRSADFILSDNALFTSLNKQNQTSSNSDGFVAHFNKNADTLRFSSFLGGNQGDRVIDVVADGFDDIYLTGVTNSNDFPVTPNAMDVSFNDSLNFSDIFISKIDLVQPKLEYSTYFGGEKSDIGKSIDLRFRNRVVVTGNTSSTFFDTTLDAIQVAYQDSLKSDAHFFEIYIENFEDSDTVICQGGSLILDSDFSSDSQLLNFQWSPEESLNNPKIEFPIATPEVSTQYTCVITNQNGESFIAEYIVGVASKIESQVSGQTLVENSVQYTYEAKITPSHSYSWEIIGGIIVNGDNTPVIDVVWQNAEIGQLRLIEESLYGCSDTTDLNIEYQEPLDYKDYIFNSYEFCEGDTILLDAGAQYRNVRWDDGVYSRYDTIYKTGEYYFTALDQNDQIYQSPIALVEFTKPPLRPNIVYSPEDNLITCISAAEQYRWYKNDLLLVTQKTRFLVPDESACYSVEISHTEDCFSESDTLCLDLTSIRFSSISIYPNPTHNFIRVGGLDDYIGKNLSMIDLFGNEIIITRIRSNTKNIDLTGIPKSLYFIKIDDKIINKIIKY